MTLLLREKYLRLKNREISSSLRASIDASKEEKDARKHLEWYKVPRQGPLTLTLNYLENGSIQQWDAPCRR